MADTGLQEPQVSATDTLRLTANDAAEAAKQAAGEIRTEIEAGLAAGKERVAGATDDAKENLAQQIGSTAAALKKAAGELSDQAVPRDLLREAAKGLGSLSDALRGRTVGNIVTDLSEFGRRSPAAFIGGAALAGFVLARFASASATNATKTDGGPQAPDDAGEIRPDRRFSEEVV